MKSSGKFQSAPRTRARGDIAGQGEEQTHVVSIRAPHSRTGRRRESSARAARITSFNPRPALAHGATQEPALGTAHGHGFNPRPALAHGATVLPTVSLIGR